MSIHKLEQNKERFFEKLMRNNKQVKVKFSLDMFGIPWKGNIFAPYYISDIELIDDEIMKVEETTIKNTDLYNVDLN